ncbi:hypothetical protein C8J56DRAFT_958751 [Mycena floridula]|nr:hypothetical protein C8J56DRAFT_958751 [Mycena floridula]
MSAPPSPRTTQVALGKALSRKRDRPPALDFHENEAKAASDSDIRYEREKSIDESATATQPSLMISLAQEEQSTDYSVSRPASATSSLDPYYFGASDSPIPPLPAPGLLSSSIIQHEPVTPARDPASIDRRGLVGVGELATPRWTRAQNNSEECFPPPKSDSATDKEDYDIVVPEDVVEEEEQEEEEDCESPWTIEAVDGESSEKEECPDLPPIQSPSLDSPALSASELPLAASTSFPPAQRKARKRTSDEFELDQTGLARRGSKEKASPRKHRSLTGGAASIFTSATGKSKDRRRDTSSLKLTSPKAEKHTPHIDGARRTHTDYSHLPPSPSSSSIQQFLRTTGPTAVPVTPPLSSSKDAGHSHMSPNVAHSLLRGTQEGWSVMDDEATAEALRKLDGLTGKSARARASVASFSRPLSMSRPGTPVKSSSGNQWEGIESAPKSSRRSSANTKDSHMGKDDAGEDLLVGSALSSDDQPISSGTTSARSSLVAKRGSTSSTTYTTSTPTTSSRDSASMSAATSVTSVSVASGRHSTGKARRNSAGSDASSVHSSDATSLKDRVASLAVNGDAQDEPIVPPVPPLPERSSGMTFPNEEKEKRVSSDQDRSLDAPVPPPTGSARRQSQNYLSGYSTAASSAPETTTAILKTPSKKWSFSALNLKLSGSPSSKHQNTPISPRAVTFGQQIRKSTSKDQSLSSISNSKVPWSPPTQPEAMNSAASLGSLSSVGSVRNSGMGPPKTPDRAAVPSRSGTNSSGSTYPHTSAMSSSGPLSPTSSSVKRGQSKRLTPSSIPFFRRSSSQSMQSHPSSAPAGPSSPAGPSYKSPSPPNDFNPPSTSVPGSAHKKSSMLSLGTLLKSSSRRSLHADSKEAAKDIQRAKDAVKEAEKEKEKQLKKEDKDRSESRISVLMGRKRGKTLSSTDPKKPKSPINLPPMQMSALEPVTAQRVARLKVSTSASASSTPSSSGSTSRATSSSRLTSQTVSSMQKQSDTSLRSTRNQLPTIAGSPSVGTNLGLSTSKEPPSSMLNTISSYPKETPTKIPRISSRSSAVSPSLKGSSSTVGASRRASTITNNNSSSVNPSPTGMSTNEFGVIENGEGHPSKTVAAKANGSVRGSPSMNSTPRLPRQPSTSIGSALPRKSNRDSISFSGLRKSSTGSVASVTTSSATTEGSTTHRFSALSPSKGLKLLSPKISLPTARLSSNSSTQNIHQAMNSPSSSRQSLSTPSPVPSSVDDEEVAGDEEMMHYIRRQQAKKMASGATQEELDELLNFPEPIPPAVPYTPQAVLQSSQARYLSEYERKEMLDFPSIYCIGAQSKKKPATLDNSTNNYGYDDDRGDYLVVNHDHLAYRYEIIDILGKGSFGQVLHCRDHCSGESVAIKIIRNKKRFHHQALVEIKILDNLRKWDSEEKHHVIKMTEHFYFRNHLCIAMELLSINLYELIKANGFVGFSTALIRRFTSQMLMSLQLMRHHRIVHCDLKPENVLLRHPAKSAIKVIDFGSSCLEHEKIYTYIQSRFYRSPEVILGMNYHMAIDMWSLGCILAELYTGFPIFPGENEQEQLSCIMEVLGPPDKDFINRSSRKKLFFETNGNPRPVVNSKGRRRKPGSKTIAQVLRCQDEEFVDFIAKCLIWDPERRLKPQTAMRHPFVASGRRPKAPLSTVKSTLSSSTLGRRKEVAETPKKSLISGPTALTSRSSRTTVSNGAAPPTPSSTAQPSIAGSASRSFRVSQSQSISNYHSSRTLNGIATTK